MWFVPVTSVLSTVTSQQHRDSSWQLRDRTACKYQVKCDQRQRVIVSIGCESRLNAKIDSSSIRADYNILPIAETVKPAIALLESTCVQRKNTSVKLLPLKGKPPAVSCFQRPREAVTSLDPVTKEKQQFVLTGVLRPVFAWYIVYYVYRQTGS